MDSDDELAEIRRRKMQEMQRSAMDDQASAEEQRRAQELEKARKQQILRQILTPDARERLSRVRLVKPELAENVENQLIQLAGMGRIFMKLPGTCSGPSGNWMTVHTAPVSSSALRRRKSAWR